jgi:pectinesterase
MIVVAKDGSGDFTELQAAVDAIPEGKTGWTDIHVRNGVYKEKLHILKPRIKLIGESAKETVIVFDDYARKAFPSGELYNTFHSYSVLIAGDDFQAEHITFVNAAGSGDVVGQAIAAYVDGDRAVFRDCRFVGCQDTVFTGPLPPAPVERGTFGGPRDIFPRRNVRQYYKECYIAGDVDFIFGSATAVFNNCEIFSSRRQVAGEAVGDNEVHGYVTAASTPEEVPYGYVFLGCKLTSDAPARSVYLGRPWRGFAKTAFVDCWLGEHIKPEGWHHWTPEREATVQYSEYGSTGPGAVPPSSRVSWSKTMTEEEARQFTVSRVLGGSDGWNPEEGGNES